MKAFNSISKIMKPGVLFALSTLLAFGSVFSAPAGAALAAAPTPASTTPQSNFGLTQAYKHDQTWLQLQQTNLNAANDLLPAIQNLITVAQSKGIDTSPLSTALATFQSQLATAGLSHTTAANVLAAHNGFDNNGNVISRPAAIQTVHDATQALKAAHLVLVQSTKDLLVAVLAFEKANQLFSQIDKLQVAYANQQVWLTLQQANLDKAGVVVTNVQSLITVAQAHSIDTTALSAGLTVFQSQLATAQSAHTTAATLLSTHAGFDASGNVTDVTAATATVHDARQALMDAHHALVQSSGDLIKVMNLWRAAHGITRSSPVYPAFHTAYLSLQVLNRSVTGEGGSRFYGLDTRLNNLLNALLKEL